MTAPVASGWSDWPGGAFTHWKAPPLHGARREQEYQPFQTNTALTPKADKKFRVQRLPLIGAPGSSS